MFQYATGRRAAYSNNTQLKLDITGYGHQKGITKREYMLRIFRIHEQFATQKEITEYNRSAYFLKRIFSYHTSQYVKEKNFSFDHRILHVCDNSYLEGYWASEKYFKDFEENIRKEFTFKDKPNTANQKIINQIKNCDSVSIHIRRGDYVLDERTNKTHGICNLRYYLNAVSLLTKKVRNSHFFIFSDDPGWCKEHLRLKYPTTYVTHNLGKKDYEDMRLMSECKHNIIANSSFSWWGAWLNQNADKIVIAPKKWFNDKSINTRDLIPKSWIKI